VPQEQTIIRYIENTKRTMILREICLMEGSATPLEGPMSKHWSISQDEA